MTEKFRILNNDELSDALDARLVELSKSSTRWTPELLSLLLHLSDRPVEKTRIEDLDAPEPEPITPLLKWSDILANDSLVDSEKIWDSIDYAADSSDDNEDIAFNSTATPELPPDTSIRFDDSPGNIDADIWAVPIDDRTLRDIGDAQFWKTKPSLMLSNKEQIYLDEGHQTEVLVTEAQMIREVLFMLLGLPTSIFPSGKSGEFLYSSRYRLAHVSSSPLDHLMTGFISIGNSLATIRARTQAIENVPVIQTLQAALGTRISKIDNALSAIQASMLSPSRPITISLLGLMDEICRITQFMQTIAESLWSLKATPEAEMSFKILERLFNQTCSSQSLGEKEQYTFMGQLFFECFHTYLKPVRKWMETGELNKQDQVIFIARNMEEVALDSIWQKQYVLRYGADGRLHAPSFLHVAAQKIFTTGKSVNFLKELGQDLDPRTEVFQPDYTTVCENAGEDMLSPFSELLDMALDKWIASMHHSSSLRLRRHLESQCGLSRSLDAVEYIYFHRDGALSDIAVDGIFRRLDRSNRVWNDASILTEHFRAVFGLLKCVDAERLSVRSIATSHKAATNEKQSVKLFDTLRITYFLPWPIANIITPSSLSIYQRISTFLLQTHRAKYLLQRHSYLLSPVPTWNSKTIHNALTYFLRYRLLWFTNILLTYLTEIVLHVSTVEMRANILKAEDVDAMIAVHETYTLRLEEQCLISNRSAPIHQALISLLDLVLLFSNTHAAHVNPPNKASAPTKQRKKRQPDSLNDESSSKDPTDNSDNETDTNDISFFASSSYEDQLRKMLDTFSILHTSIITELRERSRAGGEAFWEVLVEKLTA